MNKNDDRKLRIISAIDEDIVDRNLAKRFVLSQRLFGTSRAKRPGRKKAPWILGSIAAVLLVAIGVVLFANLFMGGQVPVYKGMTVSRPDGTVLETMGYEEFVALAGTGTTTTTTEGTTTAATTTTEPLWDPNADPGDNIYYAMPNDTVLITVHIDNPDSFEILSFTLNGEKYQAYQFEKGSDSEHLILEVKIPDVKGMHSYTIDAIKYVDGTEIKDVRMEGNKTVLIGVYTDDQPVAGVTSEQIGYFDVSFNTFIQDESGLLQYGNGDGAYAVLYRGREKIMETEIDMNGAISSVRFEDLAPSTHYRYEIHLIYDNLSGDGIQTHVLYERRFTTKAILGLKITNVTQTTFDYSTEWLASFPDGEITEIRLLLDGEEVRKLGGTQTVTDLWSNRSYTVEVDYTAGGKLWTVTAGCKTKKKTAPTVSLNLRAEKRTVSFTLDVNDPDGILTIDRAWLGDNAQNFAQDANGALSYTYENLLSGMVYWAYVEYSYDLNEGSGVVTKKASESIQTERLTLPVVSVSAVEIGKDFIRYEDKIVSDHDGTNATITRVYLADADETELNFTATDKTFSGLLSGHQYYVVLEYTYDLNNGEGVVTRTKKVPATTVARVAPTVELWGEGTTKDSASFDYSLTDPDETNATITRIYLTEADGTELNFTATDKTFSGLLSGHQYYVVLEYTYDLKDGAGTHTETVKAVAVTRIAGVTINSATLLTDSTLLEGASLGVLLDISDIENVTFQSVTFNGKDVMRLTDGNGVYTGSYIPTVFGEYELCITTLTYTLYGKTYTIELSYQTGCEVVVIADIKIEKITFANGEYYTHNKGTNTYYIHFSEGAENYTFHSILEMALTLGNLSLTKVSDRVYSFAASAYFPDSYNTWSMLVEEIQYGIGEHVVTKQIGYGDPEYRSSGFLYLPTDAECIEVSTPADLQNMQEGGYYILANDIDMAGIAWTPVKVGYLNGNGYQIKNLTMTFGISGNGEYDADFDAIIYSMIKADVMYNVVLANPNGTWIEIGDAVDTNMAESTATFLAAYGMIGCHVIDGEMTVRQTGFDGSIDTAIWAKPIKCHYKYDCSASGNAHNYNTYAHYYYPYTDFWGVKTDGDWTTTYYWNGEIHRFVVDEYGRIQDTSGSGAETYYLSDDGRYFTINHDGTATYYDQLP